MDRSLKSALQSPEKAVCDLNQNACDNKTVIKPDHDQQQPSNLLTHLSALLPSNFLNLPPRWKDWFIRGQSGILLISCFYTLVSCGPSGLFLLTILVQVTIVLSECEGNTVEFLVKVSSYYELMRLGQSVTKVDNLNIWVWLLFAVGKL